MLNLTHQERMQRQNPNLPRKHCVICDQYFNGYGNNPAPVAFQGVCCDNCNFNVVIFARLGISDNTTLN